MDQVLNPDFEIVTTLRQRLIETYDAVVWSIDHNEIPLTEELLETTIPETLFEYAVLSGWLPEPTTASAPREPFHIAHYTVEKGYAESFFALLEGRIAHWLHELESDQDRAWEMRVQKLMPTKSDPTQDTPEVQLEAYRLRTGEHNWKPLAEEAATFSNIKTASQIESAIYRILDGANVNEETRRCLAEVISTPGRAIDCRDLRWPKNPRKRSRRKSANKK